VCTFVGSISENFIFALCAIEHVSIKYRSLCVENRLVRKLTRRRLRSCMQTPANRARLSIPILQRCGERASATVKGAIVPYFLEKGNLTKRPF
jgi:hypothetical protein